LIDGLIRVHNDLLSVPFVLVGLWLWWRGRSSSPLVAVSLGALVKLTVAPIGLVMVANHVAGRQWRALLVGALACALVTAGLYAPFWFGFGTLESLFVQVNRAQWSIGSLLLELLSPRLGANTQTAVRVSLTALWALATAWLLRGMPTRRLHVDELATRAVLVTIVGLLCLPMAFYSHYLMPVIALAALADDARIRWLVLALSFGAEINSVLGVDSFAGGPTGTVLDVIGSCVIVLTAAIGLVLARPAWRRPARAT
jgi:hypothetical protein